MRNSVYAFFEDGRHQQRWVTLVSMVWETPGTLYSRPIIEHQRRELERRGVAQNFFGPILEMMRWTVWCLARVSS